MVSKKHVLAKFTVIGLLAFCFQLTYCTVYLGCCDLSQCLLVQFKDPVLTEVQIKALSFRDPLHCYCFRPPLGHMILSAGENGLVAVSSQLNGATIRVIRDHKGATVSTIQCVNEQVSSLKPSQN